jgi:hypothetical protein
VNPSLPRPLPSELATSNALGALGAWAVPSSRASLVLLGMLAWSASAGAQERPSEDEMFGGPAQQAPAPPSSEQKSAGEKPSGAKSSAEKPPAATASPPASAPTPAEASKGESRDAQILGGTSTPMFTEEAAPDNPLTIGGQLYLRSQASASQGQPLGRAAFSTPSLLDVYLDARPNERVRGFVLARVFYDATLPSSAAAVTNTQSLSATNESAGAADLSSLYGNATRGPRLVLDQMWLNFDIAHSLFVTAGTQHVRWGTGRFWAPTDYLHLIHRNPLDVFDARTGTAMLKLHVPIESKAWNFYGYAVTESDTATPTLNRVAGAARAEFVLGPAELGLGVFAQRNERARFAADLSTGIGDVDVYSEVALRDAGAIDRVHYAQDAVVPETQNDGSSPSLADVVEAYYPRYRQSGYTPQVVAGLNYSHKYNDNDVWTIGAEYFYNSLGYGSPAPYPGLVLPRTVPLQNPATFFYLGKVYGAVFISFPAPYSLDNHSFTLSTLGNFSDRSFISRFDYSLTLLTHVRFEAFFDWRFGNENGEFRFGASSLTLGDYNFSRAPALFDFGLALRIAI